MTQFFYRFFRELLVGAGLLLGTQAAFAQGAALPPHGYDFMTVTTIEAGSKASSKMLLTPAFQGKAEVPLEILSAFGAEKYLEKVQANTQLVNQQLSELTAAGWELVTVYAGTVGALPSTRYLLRKAKS